MIQKIPISPQLGDATIKVNAVQVWHRCLLPGGSMSFCIYFLFSTNHSASWRSQPRLDPGINLVSSQMKHNTEQPGKEGLPSSRPGCCCLNNSQTSWGLSLPFWDPLMGKITAYTSVRQLCDEDFSTFHMSLWGWSKEAFHPPYANHRGDNQYGYLSSH